MDKITVNGREYYGNLIYEGKTSDIEISIYVLNFILEKYLVLQKQNGRAKTFIATGMDKINSIIELLNEGVEPKEIQREIDKKMVEFKNQCSVKKLKKTNKVQLKKLVSDYYCSNYHIFTILGLRMNDLIKATV